MTGYKPIAFLFPGQASQYVGLGLDLHKNFSIARDTFREASDVLGFDVAKLCFEGTKEELALTVNTQPVILTVSIASWRVFYEKLYGKCNIVGMAGHSLGEYSALVAAGAISFADALRTVRLRGQAMQEAADNSATSMMAAIIGLSFQQIAELCEEPLPGEILNPANFNSPSQVVVSGHRASVELVGEKTKKLGGRFIPLKVSAPFHCDIMKPVESVLADHFRTIEFKEPKIPVIKNTDAMTYRGAWEIPRTLVYQVTSSVIWDVSVNHLVRMGAVTLFVPCPSKVIVGLMEQINDSVPVYGMDDWESMRTAFESLK